MDYLFIYLFIIYLFSRGVGWRRRCCGRRETCWSTTSPRHSPCSATLSMCVRRTLVRSCSWGLTRVFVVVCGRRTQNTVQVTRSFQVGKGYHHIDSEVKAYGLAQYLFSAKHRFTLQVSPPHYTQHATHTRHTRTHDTHNIRRTESGTQQRKRRSLRPETGVRRWSAEAFS